MLNETEFRTEDLPAGERFEAWEELLSHAHAPMHQTTEFAADFRAHVRLIELGEVVVWPAQWPHLTFHRTPRLIRRSDPEHCHLSLCMSGNAVAQWQRSEAAYHAYDFHVTDTSIPYDIMTDPRTPITMIGVEVPKTLLGLPWGRAQQIVGRGLSGREGVGALLAQFLTGVTGDTSVYKPADGQRLAWVLSDLVTALFAQALEAEGELAPEARTRTLALEVKSFIRRNLRDADLTPSSVAAARNISRGHLHRLFQAEGTTVAAFIRDQRLEAARRDLTDPGQSGTPIHAIAARWGFRDHATFTRTFRSAYGVTPRDYRHAPVLAGPAAAPAE